MRQVVKVREGIIKDKNVTDEDYRVYTYLLTLEKFNVADIEEIAQQLKLTEKQVIKSIIALKALGYAEDLKCIA